MSRSLAALVDDLRGRSVNYAEDEAPPHVVTGWHRDGERLVLGREAPGEIASGGLAEKAAALVASYEFADPAILRAVYRTPSDLVGRDMLLVGRFLLLRFAMGVRVTEAHDEVGDSEHRIGWSYQTLEGHLEQGKLTWEIAKDLASGAVEFRIRAFSRRAPIRNPVVALGFRLFGRRTQMRFYDHALRRLAHLLASPAAPPPSLADGLARAPGGRTAFSPERFTIRLVHPGRTYRASGPNRQGSLP
jgi:uncharacterized protein (UPF0548 family)